MSETNNRQIDLLTFNPKEFVGRYGKTDYQQFAEGDPAAEETVDVNGHKIPKSVHDHIRRGAVNGAQNSFIQTLSNQLGANLNLGSKPTDIANELKSLIDAQVKATIEDANRQVEETKQTSEKTIQEMQAELEAETAKKMLQFQTKMQEDSFKDSVKQNLLARGLVEEYQQMLPAMIDQFAQIKTVDGHIQIWEAGKNEFKLDANNNRVASAEQLADMFANQFSKLFLNPKKMPGIQTGNGTEPPKKGFDIKDAEGKSIEELIQQGVSDTDAALKAGASQVSH